VIGGKTMNLVLVQERTAELIEQLTSVWEESVKETHLFLSDSDIAEIKEFVPQALQGV
jgi:putative acetyltransferase